MQTRRVALLAIIGAVVFWGLSFISIKIAVAVLPPMTLGAFRFFLGTIILFFIKGRLAPEEHLVTEDIPYLAGAGLIGVTAYFFFENNGVARVSASEASIIIAAIPVLAMLMERFLPPRQPLHLRRWAGAALSMFGVYLVVFPSLPAAGPLKTASDPIGYLFMFGAALSWVGYAILTQGLSAKRSRIYIVFWQSVFGFLGFLPFAFFEHPAWEHLTWSVLAHVAYLGIFCSALGYWFYVYALQHLGVGTSSVFINLIPVVTVVAGFIVLQERLAALQWWGALAVISGVYLATLQGLPVSLPFKRKGKT
jgi:drug/metabolite transporter (DMT)-like permease